MHAAVDVRKTAPLLMLQLYPQLSHPLLPHRPVQLDANCQKFAKKIYPFLNSMKPRLYPAICLRGLIELSWGTMATS